MSGICSQSISSRSPTAHLRVLFVLVVLAHRRRRVLHVNVTAHPTAEWTAQQIVDAFPEDTAPSYLLRDRDQVYVKSSRPAKALGKIPSWNGSSARSGASVWTMCSFSASGTCAAS